MTTNTWDALGRLSSGKVLDASGALLTSQGFAYEPGGLVIRHTNALGGITETLYTSTGQPRYRKNPDDSTNGWAYYLDGRLRRAFGRNGAYAETTYDDANRKVTSIYYSAAGTPLEFAYELSWQGDAQQRPPGSWATQSRRGVGYTQQDAATLASQVQYVIDFQGPALDTLPPDAAVKAVVTAAGSGRVIEQIAYRNPASPHQKGWRMTVRVQRDNTAQPVELRAFLQHGNDIVSETWTNIILPE